MKYSLYFQAHVQKELCWIVTSTMRFTEYVAFDRTVNKENSVFEFFVSPDLETVFLSLIDKLMKRGVILKFQKMPNRLIQ